VGRPKGGEEGYPAFKVLVGRIYLKEFTVCALKNELMKSAAPKIMVIASNG
jgi:hypothetical protein